MDNRHFFIDYLIELKSAYGKDNLSLRDYLGGEVGTTEQRPFDKERRHYAFNHKIEALEMDKTELEQATNPDLKPSVLKQSIDSVTRQIASEKANSKKLSDLVNSKLLADVSELKTLANNVKLPFTSEKNKTESVNAIIEKLDALSRDLKEQLLKAIQIENENDTQKETVEKASRLARAIEECSRNYLFNVITTASAGSRELNWLFINRVATIFGRYSDPHQPTVDEAFDLDFQKHAFDQHMLAIINNDSPDKWHKHLQVFGEEAFKNYLAIISVDRDDYENFKASVKGTLKEAISNTKRFSADDIKAFEKINEIVDEVMPEMRARASQVFERTEYRPSFWKKFKLSVTASPTSTPSQQRQNDNASTSPKQGGSGK